MQNQMQWIPSFPQVKVFILAVYSASAGRIIAVQLARHEAVLTVTMF